MMYKGYYIEKNSVNSFQSREEIDEFLKKRAVEKLKTLYAGFENRPDMEHSIAVDKQEKTLHDSFGFTWDEIENIEIQVIKETN